MSNFLPLLALRLLVDPSHVPAVVICAMGKDRTGVISALIGHICGRTKEQLVEDYAKTQVQQIELIIRNTEEAVYGPQYSPRLLY